MSKRLLLLIALVLSLVLFAHTQAVNAPATPPDPDRKVFMLEVVSCPEVTACVMNVIGEPGLLSKQIAVGIGSYQGPSIYHARCNLEKIKGKVAAAFLQETLRNADLVLLVDAYKNKESAYLTGTLLVDGRDITVMMFERALTVPRGIKVDWCEKISRGLEI